VHVHVASLGASLSTGCPPPRTLRVGAGRPAAAGRSVGASSADRIALLPAADFDLFFLLGAKKGEEMPCAPCVFRVSWHRPDHGLVIG
jgi:hypothetical protein